MNSDLFCSIYASVLPPRSAIYLSAPITSGWRYLEWVSTRVTAHGSVDDAISSERDAHHAEVIAPNLMHARKVAGDLRRSTGRLFIDPTEVPHVQGWKQSDWLDLWEKVLAKFACAVVMVDGWHYSYGCSHEFLFAVKRGLPTYAEGGQHISPQAGALLMVQAIKASEQMGIPTGRLKSILAELSHLEGTIGQPDLTSFLTDR